MKETVITSVRIKVRIIDNCTNPKERTERLKSAVIDFLKEGQVNEKSFKR